MLLTNKQDLTFHLRLKYDPALAQLNTVAQNIQHFRQALPKTLVNAMKDL